MATVKFQSQLLLTPMDVPRVRASRGKISGTYTQGTQFTLQGISEDERILPAGTYEDPNPSM